MILPQSASFSPSPPCLSLSYPPINHFPQLTHFLFLLPSCAVDDPSTTISVCNSPGTKGLYGCPDHEPVVQCHVQCGAPCAQLLQPTAGGQRGRGEPVQQLQRLLLQHQLRPRQRACGSLACLLWVSLPRPHCLQLFNLWNLNTGLREIEIRSLLEFWIAK